MKIVEKKNLWFCVSGLVMITGIITMSLNILNNQPALNWGIDFTGGTAITLTLHSDIQDHAQTTQKIRESLHKINRQNSVVKLSNNRDVMIHTTPINNTERMALLNDIKRSFPNMELLETDIIGPTIGAELKRISIWLILIVSIVLLVYCSWRFELLFGLAALIAVAHDAIIMICISALTKMEINTAFVAAVLTILGYSINDTIVIFDRIRENQHLYKDKMPLINMVNRSISQMLGRSIHTSTTTILVISALALFGGVTIRPFAYILLIGVISGTYSSLFIASPVLVMLWSKREQN